MLQTVKIWLRIIIGFVFAVCVLVSITAYALTGTVATDSLEIIITEATARQNAEVIFIAHLQPLNIQIALFFAIFGMALCLIFLYFLEHHLGVFVAPGVISVFSVILFQILLKFITDFIPADVSADLSSYINQCIARANFASFLAAAIGLFLVVASFLDYRKRFRLRATS